MKRRILGYLASFLAGWAIIVTGSAVVIDNHVSERPDSLTLKLRDYSGQADSFDLIFLGDSRTYCGFHPEFIDPVLGTSSINLASWANWLPTQYLFIKDLVSHIPEGTTVVWSIGRSNLSNNTFRDRYPLRFEDALLFHKLDLPFADIHTAWLSRNPLFAFVYKKKSIYNKIIAFTNRALPAIENTAHGQTREQDETHSSQQLPAPPPESELSILDKEVLYDSGKPTSIGYMTKRGGYCRYELDRAFFRNKESSTQIPPERAATYDPIQPTPSMDFLLEESLKLFHEANVKLALNVIEDSPYSYDNSPEVRKIWKRHLLAHIREKAAPYGFPVLEVNQDSLSDDDYFDHNHLNYRGIKKFSFAFTQAAKPLIQ